MREMEHAVLVQVVPTTTPRQRTPSREPHWIWSYGMIYRTPITRTRLKVSVPVGNRNQRKAPFSENCSEFRTSAHFPMIFIGSTIHSTSDESPEDFQHVML